MTIFFFNLLYFLCRPHVGIGAKTRDRRGSPRADLRCASVARPRPRQTDALQEQQLRRLLQYYYYIDTLILVLFISIMRVIGSFFFTK